MSENTYTLGRVGLRICGDYNAATDYTELDVVNYNGSSFVALDNCTNVTPEEGSDKWCLIARGNPVTTITYMAELPSTGEMGQIVFVPAS